MAQMRTLAHLGSLVGTKSQAPPVSCDADGLRSRLGYDVMTMRSSGYDPSIIKSHEDFNGTLESFLAHSLIGEYLATLTPVEVFGASGVRVLPLEGIRDEIQQ